MAFGAQRIRHLKIAAGFKQMTSVVERYMSGRDSMKIWRYDDNIRGEASNMLENEPCDQSPHLIDFSTIKTCTVQYSTVQHDESVKNPHKNRQALPSP